MIYLTCLSLLLPVFSVLGSNNAGGVHKCPKGLAPCRDGICIPIRWFCDGEKECKNGEDEDPSVCGGKKSQSNPIHNPWVQPSRKYSPPIKPAPWAPQKQIHPLPYVTTSYPWAYVTTTSATHRQCRPNYFFCDYKCVPTKFRCDGERQCSDGSDEKDCYYPAPAPVKVKESCPHGNVQCFDGPCIPVSKICDGYNDCKHTEDEFACAFRKEKSQPFIHQCFEKCLGIVRANCTAPNEDGSHYYTKPPTPAPIGSCGQDFIFVHDRCVKIHIFPPKSWDWAEKECQKSGSVLVEIDNGDFFVALVKLLNATEYQPFSYWTRANDKEYEDQWRWGNKNLVHKGAPLWTHNQDKKLNIYKQEPTGGRIENCGILDDCQLHYLNDEICEKKKPYICQKEAEWH